MVARALDVVFPRHCAGCGEGAWPFCVDCAPGLVAIEPPWCDRCGSPSLLDVPRCRDCPPAPVATARAPFLFQGPARKAIHRLKFSGWRDVASALAAAIAATPGLPGADVVTWVPLARRRLSERGYDQARALAAALGDRLDLPVVRLLRRTTATGPQARLGGRERRDAMRGAFVGVRASPPRVLVVDDVLTTGATVAACAEALVASGAREVHVAVAARSVHPVAGAALRAAPSHAYPRGGPSPGLWLPGDHPR